MNAKLSKQMTVLKKEMQLSKTFLRTTTKIDRTKSLHICFTSYLLYIILFQNLYTRNPLQQ